MLEIPADHSHYPLFVFIIPSYQFYIIIPHLYSKFIGSLIFTPLLFEQGKRKNYEILVWATLEVRQYYILQQPARK